MARRIAFGACLLSVFCLLWVSKCAGDEEPGAGDNKSSKLDAFSQQAMKLWRRDIEAYRRTTKDPQAIRAEAEEFMRTVQLGMLPHPRGLSPAKTAAMGKKLFEQGCQDPLVKTYYGRAICSDQGSFYARQIIIEALNEWTHSGYPGEYMRVGVFTLYGQAKDYMPLLPAAQLRKVAATLASERAGDQTIDPEMRRVVYYELSPLVKNSAGEDWEGSILISEACGDQEKIDPWVLNMVTGDSYVVKGWHHRGGDWAYKVTPEGFRLFHDNLQRAAEHFNEAMKLHPDYPEAAVAMIPLAMAGESYRTSQEWFDQAVAAEFDYMPAYDRLKAALLPWWGGSHEEMYDFACRCADSKRYDTNVPYMFLNIVNSIDKELDYNGEVWLREGVYERVKEVLEGMAGDASRSGGEALHPSRSSVMSVHAAIAERTEKYADARRLLDELGERFDREIFDNWCANPEMVLACIYVNTGKGAEDFKKAYKLLDDAPKPLADKALEEAISLNEKALAADENEYSKDFYRSRIEELKNCLVFNSGEWFEKGFNPKFLLWFMKDGIWSAENEHSAVGHAKQPSSCISIKPVYIPQFPLEIEFEVEVTVTRKYPIILGLFIPEKRLTDEYRTIFSQFYIRSIDNQAGIEIGEKAKTVPCELKQVNRLRVQLADGFAALYVNDKFCLDYKDAAFHPQNTFNLGCYKYLYPNVPIRISNVRMHKWAPAKKETSATSEAKENKEETPDEKGEAKHGDEG